MENRIETRALIGHMFHSVQDCLSLGDADSISIPGAQVRVMRFGNSATKTTKTVFEWADSGADVHAFEIEDTPRERTGELIAAIDLHVKQIVDFYNRNPNLIVRIAPAPQTAPARASESACPPPPPATA